MSPLLEISLFIVAIFWTIPLCWAVYTFVRSIPDRTLAAINYVHALPTTLRRINNNARFHRNQIELKSKELHLESEYRDLQSKLITQRAQVAAAIVRKVSLIQSIESAKERIENLKAAASDMHEMDDKQRRNLSELVEALPQLVDGLAQQERVERNMRDELTELEVEVQKLYTRKQIQIAFDKAEAADKAVRAILESDRRLPLAMERMENKVAQREFAAYGKFLLEDHYVCFPKVAKTLERLEIGKLELEELNELFEAIDLAAIDLSSLLDGSISYEKVLKSQANSAQDPDQFLRMIEASKICTQEFMRMHEFFAEKEREIFMRISSLEPPPPPEEYCGE
jgi:phage shock protein A